MIFSSVNRLETNAFDEIRCDGGLKQEKVRIKDDIRIGTTDDSQGGSEIWLQEDARK